MICMINRHPIIKHHKASCLSCWDTGQIRGGGMSGKNVLWIILSLLGLALGVFILVSALWMESPNYVALGIAIFLSLFSIGWLFNTRWVEVVTGLLLIPVGLAGSLWTIWDFIKDILHENGVIGNFPLLGYNMTIFLVPYVVVFGLFCWLLVKGISMVKDE